MGSMDEPQLPENFDDTKIRINSAFEHLRSEMKEIQRQDIVLLKQMMYIRHTIMMLSNYPDRRSYSISALDPPAQVTASLEMTSRRRPSLTRVQSAPLERNVSEDTIPEEDEEDDELAQSFNSTASDTKVTGMLGRPTPETDFIYALGPLPPVFRRLLESSTPATSNLSGLPGSMMQTQHMLKEFNNSYSPMYNSNGGYDNSLRRYVTKRRMLQRQKSVDDNDSIVSGKIEVGHNDHLQSQSSTELEL